MQLFSMIEKYRDDKSIEFKIGCPLDFGFVFRKSNVAVPCASGISRCAVRPNGNVIPCPAFKDSAEFIAGNVNLHDLSRIWNRSSVFKSIRNFDCKRLRGLCTKCPFLDACKGRCHAQRYSSYSDLYEGPDPYCPLRIVRLQNKAGLLT
jgi:radical SAM protein with 4Fe4S-binding SPASM domain